MGDLVLFHIVEVTVEAGGRLSREGRRWYTEFRWVRCILIWRLA